MNDPNEIEQQCYVSQCNECVCKITTLSDKSTICSSFGMDKENSEPIETASSNEGIPLCTYHYGILYRHLNPSHLKCKTCSKHISDITKSQAVPEPGMIGAFLSENTDSNESISSNDRVCFTCYKSHLLLLKHLKGSVKSTDSDLKTLIDKTCQHKDVYHIGLPIVAGTDLECVVRLSMFNSLDTSDSFTLKVSYTWGSRRAVCFSKALPTCMADKLDTYDSASS